MAGQPVSWYTEYRLRKLAVPKKYFGKGSFMRCLLFLVGGFAFVCGTIGIILPILPTVPFYLLATVCFAKSSKRFHRYLIRTRFYRRYCEAYLTRGGMTRQQKMQILILSSVMLTVGIIFAPYLWLRIFLLALMVVKYYIFILRIPTLKEEKL